MLYRQHCVTNCVIGATLELSSFYAHWGGWEMRLTFAGAFLLATFWLSPDLDLHHSSPSRNWLIFRKLWWPYSKIFRHRGWSHFPVLGSLTRLSYLCTLLVGLMLCKDVFAGEISLSHLVHSGHESLQALLSVVSQHPELAWTAFFAVIVSDLAHAVGDFLWPGKLF